MTDQYIYLKIGKKEFFKIDVVSSIAEFTNRSKSEVKRLIKEGGIDILLPKIFNKK